MFDLGVIDHVRLNLASATKNYTVHAKAAERLAGLTSKIRIGVLGLLAIATATTLISVFKPVLPFQIGAVIAIGVSFVAFASYLAVGMEARVHSQRSCAHRLWIVCDRHRALLAEIHDGILDRATILQRRDELGAQIHAVYEQAFPPDQVAYEGGRQAALVPDPSDGRLSATPLQANESGRETTGSVRH